MSNIRPYIIINGKNSNEINGLIISSLPPISKPPMRAMSEEIDGRDGDIITKLGFSAYDKTIQIGLAGTYDVNAVIEYFNQEGIIIFSNEPDKYYRFTQLNGIDFEKLIRFKTASVTFHCQPFKYSNSESPLNFFEPQTVEVTNSGNIYSKPELAITGKGFVDMKINNQDVLSLDFGESQQTLIIDSEKMNCYGARSNINKLDVAINPKQDLNGYESVWLAPNDTAPYHTRINNNIGNLALEKLVGVSCVFNQNLQAQTFTKSFSDYSVVGNGNGTATLTIINPIDSDYANVFNTSYQFITGHKYYAYTGNDNIQLYFKSEDKKTAIFNSTNGTSYNNISLSFNRSLPIGEYTIYLMLIDLTAMFGSEVADYIYTLESGTAGAGVSLFKSLFADEYYPYTANTLMSAKPTGKKIVGKNLFNGEYEAFFELPVVLKKGTVVTASCVQTTENLSYIYYYDKNQNLIDYWGMSTVSGTRKYRTFTIDRDCYYMRTYIAPSNDVQVEYGSTPTAYEPYSETTIVYSGNELRGLLKVGTDGLYADGDIDDGSGSTQVRYELRAYQSGDESLTDAITDGTNTVVKLATPTTAVSTAWSNPIIAKEGGTEEFIDGNEYSIVDLGSLTWEYVTNRTNPYFRAVLPNVKTVSSNDGNTNVSISNGFTRLAGYSLLEDSTVDNSYNVGTWESDPECVNIVDKSYTDADAFKTAMNGVYLIYENTNSVGFQMFTGHDTVYGNICAINGWDECSVYRNGVNQWDEVTEAGSIDATTGANATDSSKLRSKNYIAVKSGKSYYFHTNNYDVNIYGYDSNKAFVSAIGTATKDESITIPNGIDYLRFVIESGYGTTYNHDISINYPSTITGYVEFEGISNTFELGNDIVYGGVLDVATGILKLSCELNTLGAFNYTYSDGYFKTDDLSDVVKAPADHDSKIKSVCEAFVYRKWNELANYDNSYAFDGTTGELRIKCSEITDASSFKSLMRNIHILYEVITPVEIQLTAWEIISLIGENNIFANTGEIENCVYTKDGSEHEASGDIITFTINAHDIISDTLRNRLVTGNYDNVRFKIGKNTITFIGLPDEAQNVGEVDELSVSNYSRWL